jgi:ribosomal protein S18 acetylase RimI-like enzyme
VTTTSSAASRAISVRRVRASDWENARCVRLAALADAPDAYDRTLEEELALSDADWQARASSNELGVASCGWLAWIGDVPCGMIVAVVTSEREVQLNALWVAGNIRRSGTGCALVQALCAWARERGAKAVSLKVVATNRPAIELYEANGFQAQASTLCGTREDPALIMRKSLD